MEDKIKKVFPHMKQVRYSVSIPEQVIKKYLDEYQENIQKALENDAYRTVDTGSEVMPNRFASWSLEFINEVAKDDDLSFIVLLARNHNEAKVRELGLNIISMIQEQNFTVSETILFFRMLESLALASPLNY